MLCVRFGDCKRKGCTVPYSGSLGRSVLSAVAVLVKLKGDQIRG